MVHHNFIFLECVTEIGQGNDPRCEFEPLKHKDQRLGDGRYKQTND